MNNVRRQFFIDESVFCRIALSFCLWLTTAAGHAQTGHDIRGTVVAEDRAAVSGATIHVKGTSISTISGNDGHFMLSSLKWSDSLEITYIGFGTVTVSVGQAKWATLRIILSRTDQNLLQVLVSVERNPAKSFMQQVIKHKFANDPARFKEFAFTQYTRTELDLHNISYQKAKGKGLKSIMLRTYEQLDSSAATDGDLPVYFAEKLTGVYHALSPNLDRENIIAKKSLVLKTDQLAVKLDKFHFQYNVYKDWLPLFDQLYVSPLNSNGFQYYQYFQGDTIVDHGDTLLKIRFAPLNSHERAFAGILWINTTSFAVQSLDMHLSKKANINFIHNLNYTENYTSVYDSLANSWVYMPASYSCDIEFQSGLALLGVPVPENNNSLKFIIKNTTVTDKLNIHPSSVYSLRSTIKKKQTTDWDKPESFWMANRPDSLTVHEKNIYKMVDTLRASKRFQTSIKLIALAGSGYWDVGNLVRMGPYTSLLSSNPLEGNRIRLGAWSMEGFNKTFSIYGYGAYGTTDQRLKGVAGIKKVWNASRWAKTTVSYGSDYDLAIDRDDELDEDNIINSLLRKNLPYYKIFTREVLLLHEQYLSPNWSAKFSVNYRELAPAFHFSYRPINPVSDKPFDNVYSSLLPVSEASLIFRYAHHERTRIFNYDLMHLGCFSPVVTAGYVYGFEYGKSMFDFHKLQLSVEQRLR
ncbi:MAG: carboxypeptidase-like regulatory domain-containing protein, partial [Chitinophagaceae bacterium]|nr:carboxypeptidase-like regulatory domain-containing protein [Chitinophagaceae bacterium]